MGTPGLPARVKYKQQSRTALTRTQMYEFVQGEFVHGYCSTEPSSPRSTPMCTYAHTRCVPLTQRETRAHGCTQTHKHKRVHTYRHTRTQHLYSIDADEGGLDFLDLLRSEIERERNTRGGSAGERSGRRTGKSLIGSMRSRECAALRTHAQMYLLVQPWAHICVY